MIKEFKDFISKGGVFEAAVGLIMALAFAPIVNSLVNDVLMQIIAAVFGQPNFDNVSIHWGEALGTVDDKGRALYDGGNIFIGSFITAIITFVMIAFVVFLMVKAYNKATKPAPAEEAGPSEVDLLTEIRDSLRRG